MHTIASISFIISNHVVNLKCIPLEPFDAIFTFFSNYSSDNIRTTRFPHDSLSSNLNQQLALKLKYVFDSPATFSYNTSVPYFSDYKACIKQHAITGDKETRRRI